MLLVILDISILAIVNSRPINNDGPKISECIQKFITKNNSLYSHSVVFSDGMAPKSVEIFKYHCTVNLTLSTVNKLVSYILSR